MPREGVFDIDLFIKVSLVLKGFKFCRAENSEDRRNKLLRH
jgi:hypothetical protein